MISAEVFLLTEEKDTAQTVQKTLGSTKGHKAAEVCKNIIEVRARIARPVAAGSRRIVIVDIDEHPQQILFDMSKTIAVTPNVVFVVISKEFSEKRVLQAMQAGARHFLRKNSVSSELMTVIDRLLLDEPHVATRLGNIVTVLPCSGGAGATTVAVNLAAELRETRDQTALLIDLDPHYGSVAHYLNLKGKYGVAHILHREGPVDRHLIESCAVPAGDRLNVLLSPAAATADMKTPLNYGNLLKTLDACRETHDYIVVDAPRLPPEALADVATASAAVVLVLRLTVRDVAFARRIVPLLTEHGLTPGRILALANQAARRGPLLNPREVQRVLGEVPLVRVRSDIKKAVRSINHGLPLAHYARRSGLRRDYQRLAGQIRRWTLNGHNDKGGA